MSYGYIYGYQKIKVQSKEHLNSIYLLIVYPNLAIYTINIYYIVYAYILNKKSKYSMFRIFYKMYIHFIYYFINWVRYSSRFCLKWFLWADLRK